MKVTLIHGRFENSWEAQGLGFIGAYLRKHVPGIELNFFQGCFDDDEAIVAGTIGADFACFSCTSPTFSHALHLASRIKAVSPQTRMVCGGYHPTALPEQVAAYKDIDHVVVGEGEAALLDIVRGKTDRIVHGRRMEFAELPWVDRDLIRNERPIALAAELTGQRITSFQSHRGCPFRCKFCADGARKVMYGSRVYVRDVTDLLDEIKAVTAKYRLDLIKFTDPTWNESTAFVSRFCEEKIRRGIRVPFFSYIHAAAVSDGMFEKMAAAGCAEIGLGVESGSDRILASTGKGTTRATIQRAVRLARQTPIHIRGFFILGTPDETETDLEQTEAFAEELALDEYGFSVLCPYPGTHYHDTQPDRFTDVDWSNTDEYYNDFWHTEHLSAGRLRYWQKRLTDKFAQHLTLRQHQLLHKDGSINASA